MHTRGEQGRRNSLYWGRVESLTNLIKYTKMSYLKDLLFSEDFRAYPAEIVCKGELFISKSMNCVGSISFAQNWNIGISVHRLQYLETLFQYVWKRSSFSRLHLITETKDARP